MTDSEYFNVVSTPEQELAVFLIDVIGLPAKNVHLAQQGGAISVTTRHRPNEEFCLIMGDKEQADLWHVVGSTGFRGFVTGTYSVLQVLRGHMAGYDPSGAWPPNWRVLENRYAKARRLISAQHELAEDQGHPEFQCSTLQCWEQVARISGEHPPSEQTLAIIAQLLKEET